MRVKGRLLGVDNGLLEAGINISIRVSLFVLIPMFLPVQKNKQTPTFVRFNLYVSYNVTNVNIIIVK